MDQVTNVYRKKPVEVEALQFTGDPEQAGRLVRWILYHGGKASYETVDMDTVSGMIRIHTLEGVMCAIPGDYVIRGVHGEFYPCKPDIFAETYDPVKPPLLISDKNRLMLLEAYDDGDGNTIDITPSEEKPWFVGSYEGEVLLEGVEHNGVLYVVIIAQYGVRRTVVTEGEALVHGMGIVFDSVPDAKAYVKGLIAK